MSPGSVYLVCMFLGLYTFMLARSRELKIHQTVLISLFGFLLAFTPAGYPIWLMVRMIGGALLD